MTLKHYVHLLLGCLAVVTGCGGNDNDSAEQKTTASATSIVKAPVAMAPFHYHKAIEVSPGLFYDVLSWGRGTDSIGAFQILRSDSAEHKYTTTTGDLEGRIVDVFNSDMDTDGNPEIFIQTKVADSTRKAVVYGFEYNDDNARKLEFPKLTRSQRKGYRGNDNFFIREGKLMREFDVYNENDAAATKPIQKRLLAYDLRANSISAEQISKDTTVTDTKKEDSQPAVVKQDKPKAEKRERRTSTRSHHKESSSKKKQARRHETSRKKESHSKKRRRHR